MYINNYVIMKKIIWFTIFLTSLSIIGIISYFFLWDNNIETNSNLEEYWSLVWFFWTLLNIVLSSGIFIYSLFKRKIYKLNILVLLINIWMFILMFMAAMAMAAF
jgi:hypothetical protein